jgi:ribose transport system permease protein
LLNVPSFWQLVATGVVVILAVFVDQATRRRQ